VEQAAFGNTSGRAQGLVCQSAALIALGRGAEARDCAQAAVRAAQPFPALLVAAQHNLAVAAMATQDAELAYYASRDAIRHASKQQASPESALLLRLHRQAAARSGLPISEDAWRMEIH
jgi:hypothetical protein